MMIRSATSLRNGYDEMVRLAKEKQEPMAINWNPVESLTSANTK